MSKVTYFKGTDAKIRVELDDTLLVQQGVTDFTLVGSTIVTEFESEDGDFVKFTNDDVTVVSATVYDITPSSADVTSLQLGYHKVSIQVTTAGGTTYGAKIDKSFYMDSLIRT